MMILDEKKVEYEFNEVPMDRTIRGNYVYSGDKKELVGKSFSDIFDNNISIPKMILANGKKLLDSSEMVNHLEDKS